MPPGLEPENHTHEVPVYAHVYLEVIFWKKKKKGKQ
jgi:hypothetical protein